MTEDFLGPDCPTDAHWHYTMVKQRVWGLFDVRAMLVVPLSLVNFFGWWLTIKLPAIAGTCVAFTLLEMWRITPEIAIRQLLAWLRGPRVPAIAFRAQTYLGYRPRPLPPRGFVAQPRRPVKTANRGSR